MNETLQQVAEDVWVARRLFTLPGRVRLPLNMTVLRLRDRSLLLHSPVAIDDALAAALAAIGPVRHVVAPNSYHHLFVRPCMERYPEAALYLAPGLPRKRADLEPAGVLGADTPPWAGEIDALIIEGAPKFHEAVFFHRPSRTLLVTDLVFNVTSPANAATAMLLRMMGTHRRLAVSRTWRFFTKDRQAQRPTLEALLAWPFERVVPGHGDVYEGAAPLAPAREAVRAAFADLLA